MPTNQCTYELGGKGGKYTDVLCKSRKLQSKPTAVMAKQMIYNTRYVFATKMWTAAVPVEYMIHCTPALSQKQKSRFNATLTQAPNNSMAKLN